MMALRPAWSYAIKKPGLMCQSQFQSLCAPLGFHGSPAASLSGRDISNQSPNSVFALSLFSASAIISGSTSASYWRRMVFLNPYLRFKATSSRTALIISARGGRGSADRTKFTMFKTFRASFASDAESAKPASKNAANTVLVFFFI